MIALSSSSGSIVSMAKDSKFTACISSNNQSWMNRTTLIGLNPAEYNQGFHYYPFIVNLDRCNWSCNTLNDTSGKISVPNKKEDLGVFNIIWMFLI